MTTIDKVRALFVPGETITCSANTYFRAGGHEEFALRTWTVGRVGKTVWFPSDDDNWRGTFPTRASDVVSVDEKSATWKIGRDDHTVTYERSAIAERLSLSLKDLGTGWSAAVAGLTTTESVAK